MKKKHIKLRYVLGFMLFFVLFVPIAGEVKEAQAKEITVETAAAAATETPPEIKLNVKSKELVKGKSYTLKVYNATAKQTVTYKSSDSNIVSVTDKGVIKGLEIGTATVTVTVKDGSKTVSTLSCEVTVGVPALSIKFTKDEVLIVVGQKTTLKYLKAPYNTVEDIRFITGDSDIVSISTGGRITANSVGVANVYAKIDNGYSLCKVTVISEETAKALTEVGIKDLSAATSGALELLNEETDKDNTDKENSAKDNSAKESTSKPERSESK